MNILIGVSASVAMYRSLDLVRNLTKKGHSVKVTMTRTAEKWINPVLFSALSENAVFTESANAESAMPHIEVRENLDLYLIAPATADLIARAAVGRADDIVTATLLSFSGRRMIAPSMNPNMYRHQATQNNIAKLKDYGYDIISPMDGEAVCGDTGEGKMASIDQIIDTIENL